MKNLKKILALAIAFVMCFTMFAGALVFSDVPAGGDYSSAITLLSDLGVIAGKPDGSFGINDAITRADAVCLIARLMTGEQNPPKYNNAPVFTDVVPGSYYESSVGYCAALGITSGTGGGKFSPTKTITDGEFVAMLTRALGYDTPEHPLQWPMGNVVVAQQKGLLENVNYEYASDALRGEDAQMLANALFADYDGWAAKQNLYQSADSRTGAPTIAEVVFNLGRLAYDDAKDDGNSDYREAVDFYSVVKKVYNTTKTGYDTTGFWNTGKFADDCQAHTWVIAGVDASSKENTYVAFAISDDDNKVVDPKSSKIRNRASDKNTDDWAYQTFTYTGDITPFIGYQVELWGEMDHPGKVNEVAAIRTVEGQKSYDYNASMEGGNDDVTVDDTKLKLKDADTGYTTLELDKNNWETSTDLYTGKYSNNRGVAAVYNLWKGHEKKDRQHVNGDELLRIKDGDQFKLFDWDDDGDLDFVVKDTAKYAIVEDVTAKRVVVASIDEKGDDSHRGAFAAKAEQTADNTSVSLKLGESDLVVNADGVEEGDIVEITVDSRVYTKADDEVVTITLTKVEPDAHKLTKVSTKGTLAPFFDGEEFFVAEGGFWDLTEAKDPEDYKYEEEDIKRDFDLFLDRNGFIVYSRYSNGDSAKYMMVLETQDGGGRISAHHLPAIKALLENDKVETFDTIEKLKIYGPNGKTETTGVYDSSDFTFEEKDIVGKVYKYYTNSKGEITKLVEAFGTVTSDTNRYKTKVMSDYSFNEKSISILDEGENGGRWNLEKAKAVFVVQTPVVGGNVQSYIRKTSGVDGHYYVDREDVIAVDPDDIPNIAKKSPANPTAPNAEVLAASPLSTTNVASDADFEDYAAWVHTERTGVANKFDGVAKSAYLGYTNNNRDVNAALIGVDSFDGFGRNSVKLGILKRVDSESSEKDDEYVYTFHLAVDGKEIAEYKSDSVESLSDIMSKWSNKDTLAMVSEKDIDNILETRGLAYVEVRFDGDLVDEIVVMDPNADNELYVGRYYTVTRAVVGPDKIGNVIQFNSTDNADGTKNPVQFADDKHFVSIKKWMASAYQAGLTADTNYYAIDKHPTEKNGNYNGTVLMVTNDFEDDYDVAAAEKTDISYSSINDNNFNDQYYVVDIATEKPTSVLRKDMNNKDAVAVVIFNKLMEEAGAVKGISLDPKTTADGANVPTSGGSRRFVLTDESGKPIDISSASINDNPNASASLPTGFEEGNIIGPETPNNIDAFGYDKNEVYVKFKSGAQTGVYTISVTSKEGDTSFPVRVSDSDTVVADKSNVTINVAQGTAEQWLSITLVDPTTGKAPLASAFDVKKGSSSATITTDYTYNQVTGVLSVKQPAWNSAALTDVVYKVVDKASSPNTVATITIKYNGATTELFTADAKIADAYVGDTVVTVTGVTAGAQKSDINSYTTIAVGTKQYTISEIEIDGTTAKFYLNDTLVEGDLVVRVDGAPKYADGLLESTVALRGEDEIAIEDPVTAGIAEGKDEAVSTQAGAIYKVCKDLTVAKTTVNNNGSVTIKFSGKVDLSAAGKGADEAWPSYEGTETKFGNSVILPVEFPWFEGANGHKWSTTPADRGPFTYKLNGNGGTVIAFPIAEGKITTARKTLRWFADDVSETPDASGFEVLTGATKKIAEVTYVFDFSDVELTEISGS